MLVHRRTDQIDHDLDRLDPYLQLRDFLKALYSPDPAQEVCAVLDHAGYTDPTRQHGLDHTDHTDHIDHTDHTTSGIDLS